MNKKNYRTVLICLIVAGGLMAVVGLLVREKTAKSICLIFSVTFLLGGILQMAMFKRNPKLFDDKTTGHGL